jgi:hypothetical protein
LSFPVERSAAAYEAAVRFVTLADVVSKLFVSPSTFAVPSLVTVAPMVEKVLKVEPPTLLYVFSIMPSVDILSVDTDLESVLT